MSFALDVVAGHTHTAGATAPRSSAGTKTFKIPPPPRRPNPVPATAPTSQALLKRVPSSTPSAARWTHLRHTPISALSGTRKLQRRDQGLVRRLQGLQQQRLAVAALRSYTLPTKTNGRATSHHTNDTDSRRRSCRSSSFHAFFNMEAKTANDSRVDGPSHMIKVGPPPPMGRRWKRNSRGRLRHLQ